MIEEINSFSGVFINHILKVNLQLFAEEAADPDRFFMAVKEHICDADEKQEFFEWLYVSIFESIQVELLEIGSTIRPILVKSVMVDLINLNNKGLCIRVERVDFGLKFAMEYSDVVKQTIGKLDPLELSLLFFI